MSNEDSLQNDTDVIAAVKDELTKSSIKDWLGPQTKVLVSKLNCTRDWRQRLPSLGVKLEGGLLRDDTGNHMFLSMQRRGATMPKQNTFF